jgi:hypothetical protein
MVITIAPTPASPTGPDLLGAGSHRGRPYLSEGCATATLARARLLASTEWLGLFYSRDQATVSRTHANNGAQSVITLSSLPVHGPHTGIVGGHFC